MGAAGGPNMVEDVMVFYYDTGNGKSHKGEPTQNLITDTATFDSSFRNQIKVRNIVNL